MKHILSAFLCLSISHLLLAACSHNTSTPPSTEQVATEQKAPIKDIEQLRTEIEKMNTKMRQELRYLVREELLPEIQGLRHVPKEVRATQDKAKKSALDKIIIGRIEWLKIKSQSDFLLKARVDSGAKTCSMHAENIKEKEVDGKTYIQFESVDDKNNRHVFLQEVVRMAKVKNTTGDITKRYVIKLNLQMGDNQHTVHVNLNDREDLTYNFLIGRNLLMGKYLVDVSQSQLLGNFK